MRAFRSTQNIRKDLLQNCISKTQSDNNSNSNNNLANTMEFVSSSYLNPDICEERMFNSAFNSNNNNTKTKTTANYPYFSNFYSQAQLDRMKTYIGKLPNQKPHFIIS